MTRRLFNYVACASLLLCVAAIPLWARSYWFFDRLGHETHDTRSYRFFGCGSNFGSLSFVRESILLPTPRLIDPFTSARILHWWSGPAFGRSGKSLLNRLGFATTVYNKRGVDGTRRREEELSAPYWLIVGVLLWPAIVALIQIRRRLLHRAIGCCTVCGYDLRATPDRCPECGTIAEPAQAP